MELGLLLHLYQPPQQNSYVFKEIAHSCYLPLIKLLKQKKNVKVTINCPLSLLEWFEKEKVDGFVSEIKMLKEEGRIEVVGSGAYHPILTKIPEVEVSRQIMLNEVGLSYHLGRTEGFEGEPAFMIKNIKGFFPPELAFNERIGKTIWELGYEWAVMESTDPEPCKSIEVQSGTELCLVPRNKELSLCLAYARDSDPSSFSDGVYLEAQGGSKFCVVALDGETFGHHNTYGLDLLSEVFDLLLSQGHSFETITSIVEKHRTKAERPVVESTWAATYSEISQGEIYPRWYIPNNEYHQIFEDLDVTFSEYIKGVFGKSYSKAEPGFNANLQFWNLNKVSSTELSVAEKDYLKARALFDKALNSDKFWWSSKNPYFNPDLIKRSFEFYIRSAEKSQDTELISSTKSKKEKLFSLLAKES